MTDADLYTRVNAALDELRAASGEKAVRAGLADVAKNLAELEDAESRHIALEALAVGSLRLYTSTDRLADLDNGIEWAEEDLELVPDHLPAVTNLSLAYEWRYHRSADADDRDSMIELAEQALALPGLAADAREQVLARLLFGHAERFTADDTREDLDAAIGYGHQRLPEDGPDRGRFLHVLGDLYRMRFAAGGGREDVDTAIRLGTEALSRTPVSEPSRPSVLILIAEAHRLRFDRFGAPADLDAVIGHLEQVVASTGHADPRHSRMLANLVQDHISRFMLTGAAADLDTAVQRGEQALARTPAGHPDRMTQRNYLANAHHERYSHTGDVTDLDAAIALHEQNLPLPLPPQARGAVLSGLGGGHFDRYLRTGAPADLDHSITLTEQAVANFGEHTADHSAGLSNLAVVHRRRYELAGTSADLDAAISLGTRALRELPDDHPQQSNRRLNLAIAYAERAEHATEPADLTTAIDLAEQSLQGVSVRAQDHVLALHNLSDYYRRRFRFTGDQRDLEASIDRAERALDATPDGHPGRQANEAALAGARLRRYQNGGHRADLDAAVEFVERALADSAGDGPPNVDLLVNAATAYQELGRLQPVPDGVLSRLVEAVTSPSDAPPRTRAIAHRTVGVLAMQAGRVADAATALRGAVELLPEIAPQALDWADQERRLAGSTGLIGDTVAAHLALGEPATAVELAELGRGVVLANQLDTRTDVAALHESEPALAAEFDQLRAELSAPAPQGGGATERAVWTARRREAAARWAQLLKQIRLVPGMDGFLARPRIADLHQAAAGGAVVLVNTSDLGSDAVVLHEGALIHVPLGALTPSDVRHWASVVSGWAHSDDTVARTDGAGATSELLAWLWETIVRPVLDAAGHLAPPVPGARLPRVWWVPTGLLGLLPLHAAGLPGGPSALDHVVSSSSPTIRALRHVRARTPAREHRQLTVAMRRTPGHQDLPGCEAEARQLRDRYAGTTGLADAQATVAAVKRQLPQATFAHFACHGSSHPIRPSLSALHLHDGALTVPEISGLRLTAGELAYLSACSTAQTGLTQADEAVNLVAGFQLAGYRHVVGTLWQVDDAVAAVAAQRFYELLGDAPDADRAPLAVHEVVRELREFYPALPRLWASFVHTGP